MDLFASIISSYPTNIFSIVLGVMLVFWIFAILGMLDIDILSPEGGDDIFEIDAEVDTEMPGFVGLLHTLGLTGVPLTLVISIIALIGFSLSYFISRWFLVPMGSDLLRYILGTGVLVGSTLTAIPLTARLIKPLKPLFVKHYAPSKKDYVGYVCVVTSSSANEEFGIGVIETSGAPIQIDIRTTNGEAYTKGANLRVARYDSVEDFFEVISEAKYQQLIS
ncbi:MAG: hypothetical protein ABW101_05705 [Candidatus Thiodiazotropha sp.]